MLRYMPCSELTHHFREFFNVRLSMPNLVADGEIHTTCPTIHEIKQFHLLACHLSDNLKKPMFVFFRKDFITEDFVCYA